jgi:hypothetical protein
MTRAFTNEELAFHAKWAPSSGHPGGWRVTRQFFAPLPNPRFEEHTNRIGRCILFRSFDGAKRRADKLNLEPRY